MRNPADIPFGDGTFQDALDAHGMWLNGEGGRKLIIPEMFDLRLADLRLANLRSADLRLADLRLANLSSANLRSANLSSANLSSANLRSANLSSANLSLADLRSADLSSADLSSADLYSADLRSANLSSADLYSADLRSADHIIRVGPSSDGYEFFGVFHADGVVWIKAGCRWFTVEDAREHWTKTRGGTELGAERLLFVNFIANHFKALQR